MQPEIALLATVMLLATCAALISSAMRIFKSTAPARRTHSLPLLALPPDTALPFVGSAKSLVLALRLALFSPPLQAIPTTTSLFWAEFELQSGELVRFDDFLRALVRNANSRASLYILKFIHTALVSCPPVLMSRCCSPRPTTTSTLMSMTKRSSSRPSIQSRMSCNP